MARAMNIEKRIVALQAMRSRVDTYAAKADLIAEELINSFAGDRSDEGKKARAAAKIAQRMSKACARVVSTVQV